MGVTNTTNDKTNRFSFDQRAVLQTWTGLPKMALRRSKQYRGSSIMISPQAFREARLKLAGHPLSKAERKERLPKTESAAPTRPGDARDFKTSPSLGREPSERLSRRALASGPTPANTGRSCSQTTTRAFPCRECLTRRHNDRTIIVKVLTAGCNTRPTFPSPLSAIAIEVFWNEVDRFGFLRAGEGELVRARLP